MATQKTILSITVSKDQYEILYSGRFEPDWSNLTERERKTLDRHDKRIILALLSCPEAFEKIAGFVHCIERYHKREAKKKVKEERVRGGKE